MVVLVMKGQAGSHSSPKKNSLQQARAKLGAWTVIDTLVEAQPWRGN